MALTNYLASLTGLPRYDDNPADFRKHNEAFISTVFGFKSSFGPQYNGRSIIEAYGDPPNQVPLWIFPPHPAGFQQDTPVQGEHNAGETNAAFQARLSTWTTRMKAIYKQRQEWTRIDTEVLRIMRAQFSTTGLEACSNNSSSSHELYTTYMAYYAALNVADAAHAETKRKATTPMKDHERFTAYYAEVKRYIMEHLGCLEADIRFRDQLIANVQPVKRLRKAIELVSVANYTTAQTIAVLASNDALTWTGASSSAPAIRALTETDGTVDVSELTDEQAHNLIAAFRSSPDWCDNCEKHHKGKCTEPCLHCKDKPEFAHTAKNHVLATCRNKGRGQRGYQNDKKRRWHGKPKDKDKKPKNETSPKNDPPPAK
jgi:hypothetical protein